MQFLHAVLELPLYKVAHIKLIHHHPPGSLSTPSPPHPSRPAPCDSPLQSATPRLDLHELDPKESFIMLVDRGPADGDSACKFAQKVWNAQRAGARGAIVVNYEDKMTTMEAPDDDDEVNYRYLRNITSEWPLSGWIRGKNVQK